MSVVDILMDTNKKLQKDTQEVFGRYNWRIDIERELKELGYSPFFEDCDEKIYQNTKCFDVLLYVDWINGGYSIYNRTVKSDIN